MTRIVAGTAGGRRLAVPPRGARPTTDRVREALFNMLAARLDFDGLRVLDLFAGSGALGLGGAVPRRGLGVFVESDRRAAEVISRNIATVGLPGRRCAAVRWRRCWPGARRRWIWFSPTRPTTSRPGVDAVLAALTAAAG